MGDVGLLTAFVVTSLVCRISVYAEARRCICGGDPVVVIGLLDAEVQKGALPFVVLYFLRGSHFVGMLDAQVQKVRFRILRHDAHLLRTSFFL